MTEGAPHNRHYLQFQGSDTLLWPPLTPDMHLVHTQVGKTLVFIESSTSIGWNENGAHWLMAELQRESFGNRRRGLEEEVRHQGWTSRFPNTHTSPSVLFASCLWIKL